MARDLKGLLSELSKPVPYRTSPFAIVLLCAIAAGAIVIMSILRWPALRDHGGWQLSIFTGSALALCAITFFIVRRVEARSARRRAARGEGPRMAEPGVGTFIVATLFFGGGGAFLLWQALAGAASGDPRGLGAGLGSLLIGLACAYLAWMRIRRRP